MKKIKLFGNLSDLYKPEWLLDVQNPSEALRAINANRPGFLAECDAGSYVCVLVDESDPENTARQVTDKNGLDGWGDEVLYVMPKASGDISALAAGFAVWAVGGTAAGVIAAGAGFFAIYAAAYIVIAVAISIAISYIASLISGTPDSFGANDTETPENKPSYIFNGVVNTAKQGHRIPLLYGGPLLVGSMVLSSRINTKDVPT